MFRVSMFRKIHPCSPIATYLHSCCANNNSATRTRTTWVTGKPSHARVRAAAAAAAAAQEELKENQKDPEEARLLQLEKDFEEVMDEIDERKQFLDEMLQYGKNKHKDEVMAQIGGLVRRAKTLDKQIKKLTT